MNIKWTGLVAAALAAVRAFSLDVTLAPAGDIRFGVFHGRPVTSAAGCVNEQARITSFVSSTGVNE